MYCTTVEASNKEQMCVTTTQCYSCLQVTVLLGLRHLKDCLQYASTEEEAWRKIILTDRW